MTHVTGVIIAIALGVTLFTPMFVIAYIAKKMDDYTNQRENKWDE
jgi:hypothetical protein